MVSVTVRETIIAITTRYAKPRISLRALSLTHKPKLPNQAVANGPLPGFDTIH